MLHAASLFVRLLGVKQEHIRQESPQRPVDTVKLLAESFTCLIEHDLTVKLLPDQTVADQTCNRRAGCGYGDTACLGDIGNSDSVGMPRDAIDRFKVILIFVSQSNHSLTM